MKKYGTWYTCLNTFIHGDSKCNTPVPKLKIIKMKKIDVVHPWYILFDWYSVVYLTCTMYHTFCERKI